MNIGKICKRPAVSVAAGAPVISPDGALVGLVSTDDLLAQVAAELIGLARLVAQQPGREVA